MTEEQNVGKIFLFCKESSQERIMKCLRDAFDVPGSAHDTGLELHNGNLNVTLRIYCESAGDEEQELVRSWRQTGRQHISFGDHSDFFLSLSRPIILRIKSTVPSIP